MAKIGIGNTTNKGRLRRATACWETLDENATKQDQGAADFFFLAEVTAKHGEVSRQDIDMSMTEDYELIVYIYMNC